MRLLPLFPDRNRGLLKLFSYQSINRYCEIDVVSCWCLLGRICMYEVSNPSLLLRWAERALQFQQVLKPSRSSVQRGCHGCRFCTSVIAVRPINIRFNGQFVCAGEGSHQSASKSFLGFHIPEFCELLRPKKITGNYNRRYDSDTATAGINVSRAS